MTKRNLTITIAIGFIALFGIIVIQIHWIRSAYVQNKIRFEQNLNKALNQIVLDIAHQENIFFSPDIDEKVHFLNETELVQFDSNKKNLFTWQSKIEKKLREAETAQKKNKIITTRYKSKDPKSGKIIIRTSGNNVEYIQEYKIDSTNSEEKEIEYELQTSALRLLKKDSLLKKYEATVDSVREILDYNILTIDYKKEDLSKTMAELFMNIKSVTRPFAERIPLDKLQNSIQRAIEQYDLPSSYSFAIATPQNDSLFYKSENFDPKNMDQAYSIRLFPNAVVPLPEYLYLSFTKPNPLFNQMLWPVSLLIFFTVLLLASLLLIINNLLHHKKLSAIKTDFINNMTHEFKTPIATIQLAADSVMNEQILNKPERISYFMQLIKGENKRMNALVERILQMAQLEKKSFSLIKTEVDIHQLIEAVIDNSRLKIEQVQGTIILNLNAQKSNLFIDDVHFTNVLFNLIDNAIKYRRDALQIEIATAIRNTMFVITIKDNGQGMSTETVHHIFDKFYRLTEANVHTVKGYGLGLSYVKAIIEKHKGQIHVHSEIGIGSRFEISLPLKK